MEGSQELAIKLPTVEELGELSKTSFGYALPVHQLNVYHELVCNFIRGSCQGLKGDVKVEEPTRPQTTKEAKQSQQEEEGEGEGEGEEDRAFKVVPANGPQNPHGAWTLTCQLSQNRAASSPLPLKGKRVAIKDNIPIRGLPMCCGTPFPFTPLKDSPLISRCLSAGATIVGKAQCEYMCFSGASHTASSGPVANPLALDYHAGGSSSGCGAVVASHEADLSIGCDQGGSCRIPSALTGLVSCKPTHGLVPYTLIDTLLSPIDHACPITRTVEDNALMLNVLAGWDGLDERANDHVRNMARVDYLADIKKSIKGIRIGVVKEGLLVPTMEDDVAQASLDAAKVLEELGAIVETVSLPLHSVACNIWVWYVVENFVEGLFHSTTSHLLGIDDQGKEWDRATFLREKLMENASSWSVPFRKAVLTGEWLRQHHQEVAKVGEVYKHKLIDCYNAAFSNYEVLLMPTTPIKAKKLPRHLATSVDYEAASAELVAQHDEVAFGYVSNTMATNLTGHPTVNVATGRGMVAEEEGVALPLSVMLVANYFQEALLYRVAYALEQSRPWHSFLYNGSALIESSRNSLL